MPLPVATRFVRFGRFTLDLGTDRLLNGQTPVPVPPKALAILKILVLNRDRAVTKDELLQTVWPDTVVEEANLAQQIFTLRKQFEDDPARPAFIATIPRLGYRFIADVSDTESEEAGDRPTVVPVRAAMGRRWLRSLAFVVALAGAALTAWARRAPQRAEQLAFEVALPPGISLDATMGLPGVSPDGKMLALVVRSEADRTPAIWIKRMDRTDGRILQGTEGATQPFWSWNGRRLGFFSGSRLRTVGIDGGPPSELAKVEEPKGGAWMADDTIVCPAPEHRSGK